MKRKRFTEEQIAIALRQVEGGVPVKEACRKLQISEQTFYRWKKKFGGLGVAEVRRLKQLEDEVRRLKQLVADLSLDKAMLQDALEKGSDTCSAARSIQADPGGVRRQRTSNVLGVRLGSIDDPLPERGGRAGVASNANPGDRRGACELGVSADLGAASSGGVGGEPQACLPALPLGGPVYEASEASTTPKQRDAYATADGRPRQRELVHGLHGGRAVRRSSVPALDDSR